MLLGALFIALPWVLGYVSLNSMLAYEGVVVGALIVVCSLIRVARPQSAVGWSTANFVFGLWTSILPLTFGYTIDARFSWSSALIGVAVMALAAWSHHVTSKYCSRTNCPSTST